MTAYPAWTPASRPGIIPLRPLTFGTILGRSFAALRQNPRVLLGFALGVQTTAYVLVLVGVGAVAALSFIRLDTLRPGTDEFDAVMAGSIALTAITGLVLGLAAGALGVIVQAVVVSEVAHAAVAEKLTLGALWHRVRPVAWRLIGYALLLSLAAIVLIVIVAAAIFAVGVAALPVAIGLTVLVVLAAIPLTLWLSTKLLLVGSAIILEDATIRQAIVRSWTLIRGRFWAALGIIVLISVVFGGIAQVIGIPFSFLTSGLTTIIAPTGDPEPGAIIAIVVSALLTQIVTLLIQSVAVVVQSTATALIYIDCRMRREGLDLDLLSYVERRDAGGVGLPDPYRQNVGRVIAPRPPTVPAYAYPGQQYPTQGYAPPPYPTQPYPGPPQGYAPPPYAAQGRAPASPYAPAGPPYAPAGAPFAPADSAAGPDRPPVPPPQAAHPEQPAQTTPPAPAAPAADQWTPPGAPADKIDPESPWS